MGYGIKILVKGAYACFTRPEMKVERVSYDVMTPSAARGIIEAIYWKPAIVWRIDKIHVLHKIEFTNIRRNELKNKIALSEGKIKKTVEGEADTFYQVITDDRQQRAALILKNVAYVIEAHFEMTDKAGEADTPEKHYNIAKRRMEKGQCYNQPYLGTREFSASFEWVEDTPKSFYEGKKIDLQYMLYDIDFQKNREPIFFRAEMLDGIIDLGVVM